MRQAEGAFFGNGARAVTLEFCLYEEDQDKWIYVQLLFEYSISDQVIFARKRVLPFMTNPYEANESDKNVDIYRLVYIMTISVLNILRIGMSFYTKGSKELSIYTLVLISCFITTILTASFEL